jgi:hypothetical protein
MTPVGGLLGGALGTAVGARNTLWITSAGFALPVLWLIFSPLGPAAWHGAPVETAPPQPPGESRLEQPDN